jgi:transcriptional regulator with XRE-family HTH domain
MSAKNWEKKVLSDAGASERVAEIEDELRLAVGLTALREEAGLSQRELAKRIGVSQPRVAAIERSRNVTIDVLDQYVHAVGGTLDVSVVKGGRKVSLLGPMGKGTTPGKKERKPSNPISQVAQTGRLKTVNRTRRARFVRGASENTN